MRQALVHNPHGQAHLFRELAVLLHEYHVKGAQKYNHAQGIHDYHGKGNKTHQVQCCRKWAGDEKDNGHLPNLSQSRDEKYPGAVNLAGLKTFGKGGADQALHKGGDSAAHRGKASDIKEIPVKSSYDGGSDSHIGTA